ncbi:MAG TPA: GNAT family N-acyltransferase [Spirochaetota bacterium]|nr:GNAT family N-acyltransferase [Spirochaetota bacterium]
MSTIPKQIFQIKDIFFNMYKNRYKKKIKSFKPKLKFTIDTGKYIIKTAENRDELEELLMLRTEVFFKEMMNKKAPRIDIDKFDKECDYMIIYHKKLQQIIGTYRMISSLFAKKFYSSTEFQLKQIEELPGHKLELGRACVGKDHRNGVIMLMLWKGISEYLKQTGCSYLFGCSSLYLSKPQEIAAIYSYLSKNYIAKETPSIKPRRKYINKKTHSLIKKNNSSHKVHSEEIHKQLPPLLKAYLKVGACICGEPAWDKNFGCYDFLTLLTIKNIAPGTKKKFGL